MQISELKSSLNVWITWRTGNPLWCGHVLLKVKYSKACMNWRLRKCSVICNLEQFLGSLWLHLYLARTDWQPCQEQLAHICWLSSDCAMNLAKAVNQGNSSTDIAEHRLACLVLLGAEQIITILPGMQRSWTLHPNGTLTELHLLLGAKLRIHVIALALGRNRLTTLPRAFWIADDSAGTYGCTATVNDTYGIVRLDHSNGLCDRI